MRVKSKTEMENHTDHTDISVLFFLAVLIFLLYSRKRKRKKDMSLQSRNKKGNDAKTKRPNHFSWMWMNYLISKQGKVEWEHITSGFPIPGNGFYRFSILKHDGRIFHCCRIGFGSYVNLTHSQEILNHSSEGPHRSLFICWPG